VPVLPLEGYITLAKIFSLLGADLKLTVSLKWKFRSSGHLDFHFAFHASTMQSNIFSRFDEVKYLLELENFMQ
jgi:hypothetical protein